MKNNNEIVEYFKRKENLEIEKLACYLISLFYKTNRKYFCSRPKINRLLTIYKLSSINFDPDCFHYYFKVDAPYMIIGGFVYLIDRDVYFNFGTVNNRIQLMSEDNKEFFDGKFNEIDSITNPYRVNENDINDMKKNLLEIIFRKFASYSVGDLGKMINELHHSIPFEKRVDETNYVYNHLESNKFIEFLNSKYNNELYQNNEVFKFIKIIVNEFKIDVMNNNIVVNHVLKLVKE